MKARTRIAIACQGGGSQTAFTAGVLKGLAEANLAEQFELVSISGTSGGAVCAALVWYAFERDERPVWGRLMRFWEDNSAQNWLELTFNNLIVDSLRLANMGFFPQFALSPASPMAQFIIAAATAGQREVFRDFRKLLEMHIDFAEVASWGPRAKRPVLIIGAANVLSGRLEKFSSYDRPIRAEHILASCAVPNIFPAVQIDGEAYWDGLFSDNPPVAELIRPVAVGATNIPEEIWLIKINPTTCDRVPVRTDEIIDRRNQLEGNVSLFQQLRGLEALNDMLLRKAFRDEFLAEHNVKVPIRIPKSSPKDLDKPYHIPCIEMPSELQSRLDFESKLDRSSANIDQLICEGEESARRFLKQRAAVVR